MKKLLQCLIILLSFQAYSQNNKTWNFSGEFRLRGELNSKDFRKHTPPIYNTKSRIRLGLEKRLNNGVSLFAQIQDSRYWGQEATSKNEGNLDLHQGYLLINNILNSPVSVQMGRFKMSYGTERFFGLDDFHNKGRSFDGIKLMMVDPVKFDLFALYIKQFYPKYVNAATPDQYEYYDVHYYNTRWFLLGLYNNIKINDNNSFDILGFYEKRNLQFYLIDYYSGYDPFNDRINIGLTHYGNYGNFNSISEGLFQYSKYNYKPFYSDRLAYLASMQLNYKLNFTNSTFMISAGADFVSGDNTKSNQMNSLFLHFGDLHKFYGNMEYFSEITKVVGDMGLNDYYLKMNYKPNESKFNASLDFHHFTSNARKVDHFFRSKNGTYGQEIDLVLQYEFYKNFNLDFGISAFIPSNYIREFRGFRAIDVGSWSYLMLTTSF